ncbi:hypothetical protein POJ06DRAFT_87572 [Lipomyces tetrasporus]|uniref:Uncharacterized protein n=1 Tax=Lipomyces tetrasporus TaxID=54092 RepID=A0AAD7QWF6_9ASCO|nr:uncharacterized protein POJ06DRAFT_87572 [Lipomyces tetrasporus]KAJ8101057.1 hypothetical protein POJ06DRAFT_87572 [Lipomyces tetrasporus]
MGLMNAVLSALGGTSASKVYYFLRGYSSNNYLDPELDIALVTGGCNGLGANIVKRLRARKIPVVVLDIADPEDRVDGVYYIKCDISSREQVIDAADVIKQEIGDITILINNAAITHGKTIMDLTYEEIETCMSVNLTSQFYTVKSCLPGMLKLRRGYIVIVSSVMAYIGPIKLSAYAASKSGLLALYESLTYEVGPNADKDSGVRTILVATGQMATSLFEGVKSPRKFAAPVLDTSIVADRIVLALDRGEQGRLTMPAYARFMPFVRVMPRSLMTIIRYLSGVDRGMDTYMGTGRSELLLRNGDSLHGNGKSN